ncbi:MAG: SprT-like domain-containing protein [Gemmatimonadetes bacterium]|nr:SprT-like domain-containing protein [Gemmatimonadota bacterium]
MDAAALQRAAASVGAAPQPAPSPRAPHAAGEGAPPIQRDRDGRAETVAVPRGTPVRDAATLLATLRALGLAHITTLTLTRNRTVLVSWRGARLRVHQGFAAAPDHVLRAIVRFVTARRRSERAAAVAELRTFPLPEAPARAPRRLRTLPEDQPLAERLTQLHRTLNADRFGGTLSDVEVVVSRRMKTRLGHYALRRGDAPGQIALSRRHLKRHGWAQAAETMLHEMVHQWQDETGQPVDHGRAFRRKARELGITPAARRAV